MRSSWKDSFECAHLGMTHFTHLGMTQLNALLPASLAKAAQLLYPFWLHHCFAPPLCPTALPHHFAPPLCTNTLHHHFAPLIWINALHHRFVLLLAGPSAAHPSCSNWLHRKAPLLISSRLFILAAYTAPYFFPT